MQIEPMAGLEDVLLIKPDLHEDDRGYFYEVFNEKEFNEKTEDKYDFHVLQENESKSSKFVFRGLHFQKPPYEQAKLVRVLSGAVIDFAVDIRKDSPTFGRYVCTILTPISKNQFFVPRGFAHGFLVLTNEAVFEYKCDNYYNRESEGGLRWDDADITNAEDEFLTLKRCLKLYLTDLNLNLMILSEKDKNRITTLKDL